jgi:hypothetical protein
MKLGVALLLLLVAACGGADETAEPDASVDVVEAPLACDWTHTEGCSLCPDNRSYGAGNTCAGVVWRGRSETDFCLQTFACDYKSVPVTPIP